MYFRVSASEQRKNVKQVLLKSQNMKTAKAMIPEVEKMLFPNEKCETFVREATLKNQQGYTERYYEFTTMLFLKEDEEETDDLINCDDWYFIMKAEDEDEAWTKVEEQYKNSIVQSLYIEPVAIKELLKEEIENIKSHIVYKKCSHMKIKEATKIRRNEEKSAEIVYETLIEAQRRENFTKHLKSKIDLNKISVAEFDCCVDHMLAFTDEQQLNSVYDEFCTKYGK